MTTSHANCTHPATKAARTACRKDRAAAPSPAAQALYDSCAASPYITLRHLTGTCAALTATPTITTRHYPAGPTHDDNGTPIPADHTDPMHCAIALSAAGWDFAALCRRHS